MTPDSIFLLASITKPLTGCAMMLMVERGLVHLEDPVTKYLPEFSPTGAALYDGAPVMRVRHLLSHSSGMPDMVTRNLHLRQQHAPLSEFVTDAMTAPLLFPPGTGFSCDFSPFPVCLPTLPLAF